MVNNIWDKQYKELGFKAQRLYPNEELLRFFGATFFSIPEPERGKIKILEVGCGSGANLWMIAKEGFSAYGIDTSKEGLKLCSNMLTKWGVKATIKFGNMLEIPFNDNFFDAVIDVVSMQHICFSDHLKAYPEIKRVLKKDGKFFSYHLGNKSFSFKNGGGQIIDKFTIDNINNPNAPLANNGITCFLTEQAVEKLLSICGFININIENVIKTYNNRKIKVQYLIIKAQK